MLLKERGADIRILKADAYTWAKIRYVEGNPVRAGMVKRAEEYSW